MRTPVLPGRGRLPARRGAAAPEAPDVDPAAERDALLLVAYAAAPPDAPWPPDRARRAVRTLATLARYEVRAARWCAAAGDLDESAIRYREAVFLNSESVRAARACGVAHPSRR